MISISNFVQGLTTQVASHDITPEVKRSEVKATQAHNLLSVSTGWFYQRGTWVLIIYLIRVLEHISEIL